MRLLSLVYGVVCIKKRVTYITNQVLSSKHDCVCDLFDINLRLPKRLANCTSFTQSCSKHPLHDYFSTGTLYCTKRTHRKFKQPQCSCKLCIKDTPPSLKSLCVNKISKFTLYPNSYTYKPVQKTLCSVSYICISVLLFLINILHCICNCN